MNARTNRNSFGASISFGDYLIAPDGSCIFVVGNSTESNGMLTIVSTKLGIRSVRNVWPTDLKGCTTEDGRTL